MNGIQTEDGSHFSPTPLTSGHLLYVLMALVAGGHSSYPVPAAKARGLKWHWLPAGCIKLVGSKVPITCSNHSNRLPVHMNSLHSPSITKLSVALTDVADYAISLLLGRSAGGASLPLQRLDSREANLGQNVLARAPAKAQRRVPHPVPKQPALALGRERLSISKRWLSRIFVLGFAWEPSSPQEKNYIYSPKHRYG